MLAAIRRVDSSNFLLCNDYATIWLWMICHEISSRKHSDVGCTAIFERVRSIVLTKKSKSKARHVSKSKCGKHVPETLYTASEKIMLTATPKETRLHLSRLRAPSGFWSVEILKLEVCKGTNFYIFLPLAVYRVTSLLRKCPPLGSYSRHMPRAPCCSWGRGRFLTSEVPL